MPTTEWGSPYPKKVRAISFDVLLGYSNPIYKKVNFSDKHYLIDLDRAIHEGDVDFICNHINNYREIQGMPPLSDSEYDDLEHFYKEYLSLHPPYGVLRMAQFMDAILKNYS